MGIKFYHAKITVYKSQSDEMKFALSDHSRDPIPIPDTQSLVVHFTAEND